MSMEADGIGGKEHVAQRRVPRRYRLAPRQCEFELVDGKLIEATTGFRFFTSGPVRVVEEAPARRSNPRNIYVYRDGTPVDDDDRKRLKRDFTDYLCVLLCRLPEAPPDPSDPSYYEYELRQDNRPRELWPLSSGGLTTEALDRLQWLFRHKPWNCQESRKRRTVEELSPSEWRRMVAGRLSLFFARPQSDPIIRRAAARFSQVREWTGWREDPELQPLVEAVDKDPQLQRLMRVLEILTRTWAGRVEDREFESLPFRLSVENQYGTFVFCFPSPFGKPRHVAEPQLEVRRLLCRRSWSLVGGRTFQARWIAAAVYIGQEYLEKPTRLAGRKLTQEQVASKFGLTRRQVTHALGRFRSPEFLAEQRANLEAHYRRLARRRQ